MALGKNYMGTIIKRSLILIAAASLIFLIIFDNPKPYILGAVFGGIINILSLKLLELSTKKAMNMNEGKAKAYASVNYFIRFAIYGIVLVIAAKADYISFITTIIFMFTVKTVIVLDSLYDTIKKA